MNKHITILKNGLLYQNPTLVLLLGMCPTLAVTTSLKNGVGMGLAATAVLLCSNVVISLLRHFIPEKVRIVAYVVIIAGFVTLVDLMLRAYLPSLSNSLGIFIPLIVVNCIILARAEAFASHNPPLEAATDGVAMGLGFTLALILVSFFRELLGRGTLWDIPVLGSWFHPISLFGMPPGGFLTLGLIIAFTQWLLARKRRRTA